MAEAAPLPMNATCPRCGGGFHCGVAGPGPCACTTLMLPSALLAQLARQYPGGCLCLHCLRTLQGDAKTASTA